MSSEIISSISSQIMRDNPSCELNSDLKSLYNFKKQFDDKSQHICQHDGCELPSCGSHEISQGVFLSNIADDNENVQMLGPNFSGNAFEFKPRDVKARYATTFGGYCSRHDDELFSSFENSNFCLDSEFLHKQALRTIRKEIYLRESHLCKLHETRKQVENEKEKNNILLNFLRLNKLIIKSNLILNKTWKIYNEIWKSIVRKDDYFYFRMISLPPKEVAFACAFELRGLDRPPFAFLFVFPGTVNTLVFGAPMQYKNFVDEIFDKSEFYFFNFINQRICENLNRLVFSEKYFKNLGRLEKEALTRDFQFSNLLAVRLANFLR